MPFYTFACEGCGARFEARCTVAEKDEKKVRCPTCGETDLRRIYGSFAVSLKSGASCDSCEGPGTGCPGGCCHGCGH